MDGCTKSRVYWAGSGVYMGVYYANLSFVEFRTMIFGIHVYVVYMFWRHGDRKSRELTIQYIIIR